jgi:hydrogenase maturation factor
MCVTRAAKVISLEGARATVRYLDSDAVDEVDVSMVDAKKGSYVEVFADQAIGCITKREAEFKRDLRLEMNRIRLATH